MDKISCIYKITSPSGKIYIGQSYNVHNRILKYQRNHCKGQRKLYESLKKYGFENHTFEILQQAPKEELNQLEINYIWRFNSRDRYLGLNLNSGGFNGTHSEETKDKIRQKAIGRRASLETRKKMSLIRKGKSLSKEHRENLSKVNKERCGKKSTLIINGKSLTFNSISEVKKFKRNLNTNRDLSIPKNAIGLANP